MVHSTPFDRRSTADKVLAGVDLTGKRFVLTGCDSGLGFETMSSLAANGAHVIGLARSLPAARAACTRVGPNCTAVACDLSDLDSVTAAAQSVHQLNGPVDAIVANAGVAYLPALQTRYGVEMQLLVNHIGHFALLNQLCTIVREGAGRVVIVGSDALISPVQGTGIDFENLDGHRGYQPASFYIQSKIAAALYAKELSRRLMSRGISVNAVDPGLTAGTGIFRHLRRPALLRSAARLLSKSAQRGAASQVYLAASPRVTGITGEIWSDCRIAGGHALLDDVGLAKRLWDVSDRIVTPHTRPELRAAA